MILDVQVVLEQLRAYTALGQLLHVIINADGTLTVVYQHGMAQFDQDGKVKPAQQ